MQLRNLFLSTCLLVTLPCMDATIEAVSYTIRNLGTRNMTITPGIYKQSPLACAKFNYGPQEYNIVGKLLTYVKNPCTAEGHPSYLKGSIIMAPTMVGCSYETVARNLEAQEPKAIILLGKFPIPGSEAFLRDGSSMAGFSVPICGMGYLNYIVLASLLKEASEAGDTVFATLTPDDNEFRIAYESTYVLAFQVILGAASFICALVSAYKLFLFIQAQKGLRFNISQIALASEVITNVCRFLWMGLDPFFSARGTWPWGMVKLLITMPVATNIATLLLVGFYWTDLVNNTTGSKSTFLQKKSTIATASLMCATLFGLELTSSIREGLYMGGVILGFITSQAYSLFWFVLANWFWYRGFKLVKALNKGGKKSGDSGIRTLTRRIALIGFLLHLSWFLMAGIVYQGSTSVSNFIGYWSAFCVVLQLLSWLQIGIFNPPQWKDKVQGLKRKAAATVPVSSGSSTSSV